MRKIDYLFLVLVLVVGLGAGIVGRIVSDNRIHADIESNQPSVETFVGLLQQRSFTGTVEKVDGFELVTQSKNYSLVAIDPSLDFAAFENKKVKVLGQKQADTQIIVTSVTKL